MTLQESNQIFYFVDVKLLQVWPLWDYPNFESHADQVISITTRDIIMSVNSTTI